MTTKIQICNVALTVYAGQGRITSMTEESPAAEACAMHYDDALRSLLERHWWTFAASRAFLAQLVNDRPAEWAYRYQVPDDALAIRWVNDPQVARIMAERGMSPDVEREVRGESIYCDVATATCSFTKLLTVPDGYPQFFSDALSACLGQRIVQVLTESAARIQAVHEKEAELVDRAIMLDMRNEPVRAGGLPSYLSDRGL